MASLRETNHIEPSKAIDGESKTTNPVSGSSCGRSDCIDNENGAYLMDTKEYSLPLDQWIDSSGVFANLSTESLKRGDDVAPISILLCKAIQKNHSEKPLVTLFDGGSSSTLLNERALPRGATPHVAERKQLTTTASGTFDTSRTVHLTDIRLPEFSNGRRLEGMVCRLFNSPTCQYDIILGRDFLRYAGIECSYIENSITWLGRTIEMKHPHHYSRTIGNRIETKYQPTDEQLSELEDEELFAVLGVTDIKERAYREVTPTECADAQSHMTIAQRTKFKAMLERHKIVFDGKLGLYPHEKFKLRLKEGAVPVHKKAYPVPFKRQPVFKNELEHLVREGVLRRCGTTNWASPTFITQKKADEQGNTRVR